MQEATLFECKILTERISESNVEGAAQEINLIDMDNDEDKLIDIE